MGHHRLGGDADPPRQTAARVEVLARGYRVPALVIDFASRLLPFIAPDVAAPLSVRENPGLLEIVPSADLGAAIVRAATEALRREGSIGLIVADRDVAATARRLALAGVPHLVLGDDGPAERLTVVAAALAKGLEFDHVVVVEPAAIVDGEPTPAVGLRRLYVVLTRAVSGLTVVHERPLPGELSREAA